jgi:SAM-dependent methyltransferase
MTSGMPSWQDRAKSFGNAADEYDRMRPGYPPELFDDVVRFASRGAADALEVDAGTGKATLAFADRGIAVTAVEPDAAMAAVLTRRLAARPNVTVIVSSFEEYVPRKPVDLLFSAQAWHWTDPASRWVRAAAAMSGGGTLALFWNRDRLADPYAADVLRSVHATHAPQIAIEEPVAEESLTTSWPWDEMDASAAFSDLDVRTYRWERRLSSVDYVAYLSTHSAYRVLDPTARERLFGELGQRLPDQVDLDVITLLYLAHRTRSGSGGM